MPAFHASGRSFGSSEPSMSCCSSSNRKMMWRLYVVSSASTRMRPGLGTVDGGEEGLQVDVSELRGEGLLQRLVPVEPERAAAPDEVLPGAALRLVQAQRGRAGERRALERRCDAVRVVPVPRLVHRRPERVEPGLVVPRRHAHVAGRERRAERMHGGIEPVRALLETEGREDALRELLLLVRCEWLFEERRVDARCFPHELRKDGADRPEHVGDLRGRHVRLEVVEEGRVRRVVPLEALDVPSLQVEVALERREELREVVRRSRLDPHPVAESGRSDHLRAQLGRDADAPSPSRAA